MNIDPNQKFNNYAMIIGEKSDFNDLLNILLKNKIAVYGTSEGRLYINNGSQDLASVKKMPITIDQGFCTIRVNWAESQNNEITNIFKELGYQFYFMGDDGSWLATPYYLMTSLKSKDKIQALAKAGFYNKVKDSLWDIGQLG